MSVAIHWFRADLRLRDNCALHAACAAADAVIPIFIFDPAILRSPDNGAPITDFMLRLLASLEKDLAAAGVRLTFRHGRVVEEMRDLFRESGASHLFYNRDYEPYARERDAAVEKWAASAGITVHSFKDSVLQEPGEVLKDDGKPYGVYTPYARRWRRHSLDPVLPTPRFSNRVRTKQPRSIRLPTLKELGLHTHLELPEAGEAAALKQLRHFTRGALLNYENGRNRPAQPGTSHLSPYLRMGAVSPRTIVSAAMQEGKTIPPRATRSTSSSESWSGAIFTARFFGIIRTPPPPRSSRATSS